MTLFVYQQAVWCQATSGGACAAADRAVSSSLSSCNVRLHDQDKAVTKVQSVGAVDTDTVMGVNSWGQEST